MNFLNPLFLFGLAAAAIPIVIHLFTRRRPREVRFPSLDFLTEVNQSELRRLRLKQWLLLLLRTLAVICIALAMSRPALRGTLGARGSAASTLVVLLDQSGSMGAPANSGHALVGEAKHIVEDLLGTLGPADEMLLVPYDLAPHPVTPRPSADAGRLRAATQAIEPTAAATDHAQALEFAAQALAQSHALNRELFWLSDFQASGFHRGIATVAPAAPEGPWQSARVYLVPLAPRSVANAALTDVELAPAEGSTALALTAASFGAPAGDAAIEVHAGASVIGRGFVSLPARGEAAALLPLTTLPEFGGMAQLPNDALALDNERWFAAGRAGTLHVLLREDGPPSSLRLALEAGSPASGLAIEAASAMSLPTQLGSADVLVIGDLDRLSPTELQAVLDFYRAGGGVLLALGARADADFWNHSLLAEMNAGVLGAPTTAPAGAAWRVMRAVAGHAVLAGFPARPGEALSSARFESVRAFQLGSGARALLEFDRAHPALIEVPHALILTTPLDPSASDFAVSGAFLPLVHQCVKVLGRGTAAASRVPGDRYAAPATTGAWRIEDQDGREIPSELIAAGGATQLQSAPLDRPGLYRVLQSGTVRSTFAVNPDPRESDLAPASNAALMRAFPPGRAELLRPGADLARRVREARYGRELWSEFVLLALLLLVAETVIGRWGMTGFPGVKPAA